VKNSLASFLKSAKIKNRVLLLLLFIILSSASVAQKGCYPVLRKKNAVFVELLGSSGYVYNLTYDREIWFSGINKLNAAFGLQLFPKLGLLENNLVSFSPQVSYLLGNVHNLELGVGLTFNLYYGQWGLPFRIGYRYQPNDKGFFFRVALTPILTDSYPVPGSNISFHMWGGAGFGYTFMDKIRKL
jgi:hypothetical protein